MDTYLRRCHVMSTRLLDLCLAAPPKDQVQASRRFMFAHLGRHGGGRGASFVVWWKDRSSSTELRMHEDILDNVVAIPLFLS